MAGTVCHLLSETVFHCQEEKFIQTVTVQEGLFSHAAVLTGCLKDLPVLSKNGARTAGPLPHPRSKRHLN